MNKFVKWPSIENHYRSKEITWWLGLYPELYNEIFVITEKIHGANLQLYFEPNKPYRVGTRTRFLKEGDSFFDVWGVLARHQGLLNSFQLMVNRSIHTVRLFGELFGGKIQKGVKYQNEHDIAFFGLMLDDELVSFLDFDTTMIHSGFGNLVVPTIDFVRGLENALAYDTEFDSKVLGVDDNVCEGIVIQPYKAVYTSNGSYFLLKKKNESFKEKSHAKAEKVIDSEPVRLNREFQSYLTDARLQGVFSKYGEIQEPKQIGQYIRYMLEDAKIDFLKDNPQVAEMDKGEQKLVYNVGGTIANMLKGCL